MKNNKRSAYVRHDPNEILDLLVALKDVRILLVRCVEALVEIWIERIVDCPQCGNCNTPAQLKNRSVVSYVDLPCGRIGTDWPDESSALVLEKVCAELPAAAAGNSVLVAVDGVDGSGKSYFANELASCAREAGRTVVRASVDDFHNPREMRYRKGRLSPKGFWLDSYDYERSINELLLPFKPQKCASRRHFEQLRCRYT